MIDSCAVSNREFDAFVAATAYATEAERFGWSFVFGGLLPDDFPPTRGAAAPWWRQVYGADWRHPQGPQSDVDEAFRRARKAQEAWARTSLDIRVDALLRLHDLVLAQQDQIIDLICLESGKARKHAFEEPMHIALTARYYARTAASANRGQPRNASVGS